MRSNGGPSYLAKPWVQEKHSVSMVDRPKQRLLVGIDLAFESLGRTQGKHL